MPLTRDPGPQDALVGHADGWRGRSYVRAPHADFGEGVAAGSRGNEEVSLRCTP